MLTSLILVVESSQLSIQVLISTRTLFLIITVIIVAAYSAILKATEGNNNISMYTITLYSFILLTL